MTKQELLNIINEYVGYAESEIYEAIDEYCSEKRYNKQEISEIVEEYDKYLWSNEHTLDFDEWFDKFYNN
jgi:hypothetical protein